MNTQSEPVTDRVAPALSVRVLGCAGAIARGHRTTSFLVNGTVLVDAGTGVGDLTLEEMACIDHVLITHAHLDHIAALPLMLDSAAALRDSPVTAHALPETIAALRQHIFNGLIWPDFTRLPSAEHPFLVFQPYAVGQELQLGGIHVEVLPASHTVPAVGLALASHANGASHWVFSGDTDFHPPFWHRVNQLKVGMLVIETAFSDREAPLAAVSQHLCPQTLEQCLALMASSTRYPVRITHAKPAESDLVMAEIGRYNLQRQSSGLAALDIEGLVTGQLLHVAP